MSKRKNHAPTFKAKVALKNAAEAVLRLEDIVFLPPKRYYYS